MRQANEEGLIFISWQDLYKLLEIMGESKETGDTFNNPGVRYDETREVWQLVEDDKRIVRETPEILDISDPMAVTFVEEQIVGKH